MYVHRTHCDLYSPPYFFNIFNNSIIINNLFISLLFLLCEYMYVTIFNSVVRCPAAYFFVQNISLIPSNNNNKDNDHINLSTSCKMICTN